MSKKTESKEQGQIISLDKLIISKKSIDNSIKELSFNEKMIEKYQSFIVKGYGHEVSEIDEDWKFMLKLTSTLNKVFAKMYEIRNDTISKYLQEMKEISNSIDLIKASNNDEDTLKELHKRLKNLIEEKNQYEQKNEYSLSIEGTKYMIIVKVLDWSNIHRIGERVIRQLMFKHTVNKKDFCMQLSQALKIYERLDFMDSRESKQKGNHKILIQEKFKIVKA